jgi:hypothetical protein
VKIIAVSQDMDANKAKAFLAKRNFSALRPYFDPKLGLSLALAAVRAVEDRRRQIGREIWRVAGEMDWTGAKARALLAEAK